MEEERKWYVVTTRPRAEKKVSADLTKMGIDHFLPLQKQLRIWKDRKKWIEMPLFNSYVFVFIEHKFRSDVFQVPGIIKYVTIKGVPGSLSSDEVERIRRICNYEQEIFVSEETVNVGDAVEVIAGPLKGIKGRLTEKENGSFFSIIIENLGYTASFKIDRVAVKRI